MLQSMTGNVAHENVEGLRRRNVAATTSVIFGILGIPSIAGDPAFALLLGGAAVAFGWLGIHRVHRGASGHGSAIAGIVLGMVTLVVFAIVVVLISQDAFAGPH